MFSGCASLKSIELPSSLENIGEDAFDSCTGLTNITIPDNVKSMEAHAFVNCTGLKSIVIGSGVTSIGGSAFSFCSNLAEVYYKGTEVDWNKIEIDQYNSELTDAVRYYYSETQPTEEGNYWHYVDGAVTKW